MTSNQASEVRKMQEFSTKRIGKVLIFGTGYLGSVVAKLAHQRGDQVFVTTRSINKAKEFARLGYHPILANWHDSRTLVSLPQVDRILISVSYDSRAHMDRFESLLGGLSRLAPHLNPQTPVCFTSTTGVFHQSDGSWVDESGVTLPKSDSGRAYLHAEARLWSYRASCPTTILRMAGIYGQGRVPRIADVRASRAIPIDPYSFLNLIHVQDAARAVLAAWEVPSHQMYLIADDRPTTRKAFYNYIATKLRVPMPTFTSRPSESSDQSRGESHKRIWNARMHRDLIDSLLYPNFQAGLDSILSPHRRN